MSPCRIHPGERKAGWAWSYKSRDEAGRSCVVRQTWAGAGGKVGIS